MKKLAVLFCSAMFVLSLFAGTAMAADKFAYVNLTKIFGEYSKTKDYDKVLGDKENIYNNERDKKVNEIKQLQEKFNLLSDKEKEAKKGDIEAKIKALQEYDRTKQTDLRKDQDEKMKDILKDIETAIKGYALKNGYTMVFNDRVLVYQDKSMDITEPIIKIINKK
ncbi:MAG: OmpH family outer membrane protein [Candidatus Omnitrophota bacterium]